MLAGSGKTYQMGGTSSQQADNSSSNNNSAAVLPQACAQLLKYMTDAKDVYDVQLKVIAPVTCRPQGLHPAHDSITCCTVVWVCINQTCTCTYRSQQAAGACMYRLQPAHIQRWYMSSIPQQSLCNWLQQSAANKLSVSHLLATIRVPSLKSSLRSLRAGFLR